jgi:hypothetical protein
MGYGRGTLAAILVGFAAIMVVFAMQSTTRTGVFVDDDGSSQEPYIEAIAAVGITQGCNPPTNSRYCPDRPMSRAEMATMFDRALKLPGTRTDFFFDDNDSIHEAAINSIAAVGITVGCNPPANNRYCPTSPLTRGQMAAFINRSLDLPNPESGNRFVDDDDSPFETDIARLAAAGITEGCNPPRNNRYCPGDPITRGQMAVFLARALDLSILPAPPPTPPPTPTTTTTTVPPTEPPVGSGGSGLEVWGPRWMAGTSTVTRSRAIADANAFPLLAAHERTYDGHVAAMHNANRDVIVLTYINAAYAEAGKASTYPESWFAHDAAGNRVKSTYFGNYVMDVSNPQWWNNRADKCATLIAGNDYDGCLLDLIGTGPLVAGQSTATPVNPTTGVKWTYAQWMTQTSKLADRVESRIPSAVIYGNGLGSGYRYYKTPGATSVLFNSLDGMMAEVFVRSAKDNVNTYRNETMWKQDVDMLVDAANRRKTIFVTTKLWINTTTTQRNTWHQYALATFLLGASGDAYFTFLHDQDTPTATHPWWDLNIGTPTAKYTKTSSGIYQRNYTNGRVLVNPTTTNRTITIGNGWRDLSGNTVNTTITLKPHTAKILTKP